MLTDGYYSGVSRDGKVPTLWERTIDTLKGLSKGKMEYGNN